MELNRKELKKVMLDFNNISNRFMRVNYQDYNSVLSKFIAHLDRVEIIADYIADCGQATYDVQAEIEEVIRSYGRALFDLGDNDQEEVANIYNILKYCFDNNIYIPRMIASAYSSSSKWQDMTKEFNERVVMVLIRHIESYLTKIGIDMGIDEHTKYSITINNGQVNLASDKATINAAQNSGIDIQQLNALLEAVRRELKAGLTASDEQTAAESLEVIENELSRSTPRKSLLKTALTGLQAIKETGEFGAAVVALVQFVQAYT
jgi:hypothetical protein